MAFRKVARQTVVIGEFTPANIGENMYSPEFIKNDHYQIDITEKCFLSAEIEGPENSSLMLILVSN